MSVSESPALNLEDGTSVENHDDEACLESPTSVNIDVIGIGSEGVASKRFENIAPSPTFTYRERTQKLIAPDLTIQNLSFQRITISEMPAEFPLEVIEAATLLSEALSLRHKYALFERKTPFEPYPTCYNPGPANPESPPATPSTGEIFRMREGVMSVYATKDDLEEENPMFSVLGVRDFYKDLQKILQIAAHGPAKSLAYKRLELMEAKFNLHTQLNHDVEYAEQRQVSHRDFYNVRKVDNHVHLASCMNQKHLLRYIKSKCKKEPKTVVKLSSDGVPLTLEQIFQELKLTPYDLSIDHLDMHADVHTFQRFDRFNLKYNPCGDTMLREVFLKTDNYVSGRFLAEVVKQVFGDLEDSKYQLAEYRVSVYGHSRDEWSKVASWVVNHKLFSTNVRWIIQVPRLYAVFKSRNQVKNFQEIIDNLFQPLFEATREPEKYPEIHAFLQHVVAFDSVDDESKPEHKMFRTFPKPSDWDIDHNCPYTYYIYYMWANIQILNLYRQSKGLNMFALRPHCGESGDVDHLAAGFLTSQSIAHGLQLRKHPVMEYLFAMSQIGISLSPLSNNKLFLRYEKNPFPKFFARGLNVTLSTDDPLQIHFTRDPLVEEFSIAAQVYRLSQCDLSEIARNSVYQSGFDNHVKAMWVGEQWSKPFTAGNDVNKTNVPNIRIQYREDVLRQEYDFLAAAKAKATGKFQL
eukprot:c8671_g1_i1.p1 GENE.c8671_g1_i1~~c8671_g1_i1.p1  ORF type:complete len:692 (+),score=126.33 c8671_g1_i1:48-2123(+)